MIGVSVAKRQLLVPLAIFAIFPLIIGTMFAMDDVKIEYHGAEKLRERDSVKFEVLDTFDTGGFGLKVMIFSLFAARLVWASGNKR